MRISMRLASPEYFMAFPRRLRIACVSASGSASSVGALPSLEMVSVKPSCESGYSMVFAADRTTSSSRVACR